MITVSRGDKPCDNCSKVIPKGVACYYTTGYGSSDRVAFLICLSCYSTALERIQR